MRVYQEPGDEHVPSIVKMCRWMEVSRSGFYDWRNAPESATAKRRGILALYVKKSFEDSDDTYGYRRVHVDLVAWGAPAGPELVRSLMRELGLEPCQPRPWRVSLTEGDGQEHDIPDLVDRDFTADAPGQKMVGDITYISTWEGWLFLATVIDCHTKAVIGWAADDNYKTPLIEKAIEMAARNYPLAENRFSTPIAAATTVPPVRRDAEEARPPAIGRPYRDLLRQCDGRVVLRGVEERARLPHPVSDS